VDVDHRQRQRAAADRREDAARSVLAPLDGDALVDVPEGEPAFELRYRGQSHELVIRDCEPEPGALRAAFEALHQERYGYRDPEAEVELVTVRATRREPGPEVALRGEGGDVEESRRAVVFDGVEHDAVVLRGEPGPGATVAGPAVVELPEATVAVPPGWRGAWDEDGTLALERA
jgi:N-methylhydantoinase A/oxoprolinase/acetone carboxylase beta subunit